MHHFWRVIQRRGNRNPLPPPLAQRSDRCPCGAQDGKAHGGSAGRDIRPLALSRFSRRGAVPACENRSAAPLTAPCFCHWQRSLFVPLALSRFSRRGAVPACENRSAAPGCGALLLLRASPRPRKRQTAAPAPPRLFRPLDAARLRSLTRLRCFVHWTRSARQPRLIPIRRATVSRSQLSGMLRLLPAMSSRRFSTTRPLTMATVTP